MPNREQPQLERSDRDEHPGKFTVIEGPGKQQHTAWARPGQGVSQGGGGQADSSAPNKDRPAGPGGALGHGARARRGAPAPRRVQRLGPDGSVGPPNRAGSGSAVFGSVPAL